MSTAIDFSSPAKTDVIDLTNKQNSYLYGSGSTEDSAAEPEIRPRNTRTLDVVKGFNRIEDIKQRWDGVVVDIQNDVLTVKLSDLTNRDNPEEIIELSIEEIEDRDRPLVEAGAMFLWHVGYRYGPKYPRERFSKISFRRLIPWTESELQDAENKAKEYFDFFSANSTHSA